MEEMVEGQRAECRAEPQGTATEEPHGFEPRLALAVASAGPLLVLVAFTAPLTTLTSTATDLGAGLAAQAWVMSAMSVGAAAGLLSSGALGDDYGRRRVFLTGALLLALASLLGAVAPSAPVLIVARILQGLGGAAILSCSLGLVGYMFPAGSPQMRATGVWAAALGAGVAIGPILAAGLDMLGGWRLPYALTALTALLLALAVRTLLPEARATGRRRIDLPGVLLLGFGLAALLTGLTEARAGWSSPQAVIFMLLGISLVTGFLVVEHRAVAPMLDLSLFRRADFAGATIAALATGAGVLSLVSFVPVLLERTMGVDTLSAAFVLLAWSATTAVAAFAVRWLPARLTPRVLMFAGLLGVALAQLALLDFDLDSTISGLLPALLLAGAANGILNAALGRQAVASVPADRVAMGSGANNTARFVGSAIGITIVTMVVMQSGIDTGAAGLVAGWHLVVLATTAFSAMGALVVLLVRRRSTGTDRRSPEPMALHCGDRLSVQNT